MDMYLPRTATLSLAAVLVATALLALCGCAGDRSATRAADLRVIRHMTFEGTVADPEPAWNPASNLIVARARGGFSLFEEGGARGGRFENVERREAHFPCWLNAEQFVFGPARNVITTADGAVVPATDGLTVVTLTGAEAKRTVLSPVGFRPRLAADRRVVAQVADRIVLIDSFGKTEDFSLGFNAVPQPPGYGDGAGLAWQETPVTTPDHWTGKPVRGNLVIRWKRDRTDVIANAIEACWTPNGGLLATRLNSDAGFYRGGTDAILIPGPGQPLRVLLPGGRLPAPHPTLPLVAVTAADGSLHLIDLDGKGPALRIAAAGEQPRWNADGSRLAAVVPRLDRQVADIVVWVLAARIDPAAPTAQATPKPKSEPKPTAEPKPKAP